MFHLHSFFKLSSVESILRKSGYEKPVTIPGFAMRVRTNSSVYIFGIVVVSSRALCTALSMICLLA